MRFASGWAYERSESRPTRTAAASLRGGSAASSLANAARSRRAPWRKSSSRTCGTPHSRTTAPRASSLHGLEERAISISTATPPASTKAPSCACTAANPTTAACACALTASSALLARLTHTGSRDASSRAPPAAPSSWRERERRADTLSSSVAAESRVLGFFDVLSKSSRMSSPPACSNASCAFSLSSITPSSASAAMPCSLGMSRSIATSSETTPASTSFSFVFVVPLARAPTACTASCISSVSVDFSMRTRGPWKAEEARVRRED
mmetsp:Transcript_17074/g.40747  ORF Transcript_17074/g.40747 Transcript_17074/m.40747 type:complete len:267 (+) Transcript_17074:287-1087(+)